MPPTHASPPTELERDLELERRKAAGLQDSLKDRDKEYQKLKVHRTAPPPLPQRPDAATGDAQAQYDKIKRKALLGPNVVGGENAPVPGGATDAHLRVGERHVLGDQANKLRPGALFGPGLGGVDVGAVVGDMEAHGVSLPPSLSSPYSLPRGEPAKLCTGVLYNRSNAFPSEPTRSNVPPS